MEADADPLALALREAFAQAHDTHDHMVTRRVVHALRAFVDGRMTAGWSDDDIVAGVRRAGADLQTWRLIEEGYSDGMPSGVISNAALIARLRAALTRAQKDDGAA